MSIGASKNWSDNRSQSATMLTVLSIFQVLYSSSNILNLSSKSDSIRECCTGIK